MRSSTTKTNKTKAYWKQQCEAAIQRIELEKSEQNRHRMREVCSSYNRKPFVAMGKDEIMDFANQQATNTATMLRIKDTGGNVRKMTENEIDDFTEAVKGSILYFNKRDNAHKDLLRYRELCTQNNSAAESSRAKNKDIVIHISC